MYKRLGFTRNRDRGDTIVEVLLAMAIITSVLAGAFLVSQKSSQAVQDSQERGEMLQLLQGQVESVRALALQQHTDTTGVFDTTVSHFFCIDSTHSINHFPPAVSTLPVLATDTYTDFAHASPNPCQFENSRYNIAVSYDTTSKLFTFIGRWDKVGGGKSQEQLYYRIYPGN